MVAAARAMPLQYGLHEMSIAENVLDAVRAERALHGGGRVTRAGLRIGELSGVEVESLRFCLEVLAADSDLAGAGFEIERAPWTRRCRACGAPFRVAGGAARVPFLRAGRDRGRRGRSNGIVLSGIRGTLMRVPLERKVLNENDRIAAGLRERWQRSGTFCVNLISSPGSGKTALLERTLAEYTRRAGGWRC